MSRVTPNFTQAMRANQARAADYGTYKSVTDPIWTGAAGDRAALYRGAYPSASAMAYFEGPTYNQQYRNLVTTALQGRGRKITDRVLWTGQNDYDTSGRNAKEYQLVAMDSGVENMDMFIAMGILGAAIVFIFMTR